ncbi:ANTAR domain-containing response regulator [Anaerocolumna sp. MB42-C2]|uniref:ANTAR domain-containing response regulator n=1 Tax=Anaerocolumna sp. MB42-C2 TaxID=3070997 RepID=UPI0027E16EB8|nr:ANTAR domain-containing protein [Anaerocolumna sp. MB42-C2]WMJ89508.1 ANTAR domain-containing protein [Anaerocolumna sp. MB42-C2]
MPGIIIAFPKIEDATSIKNALVRNGFEVNATCTTGAQVVGITNELDDGIVICGYRFSDMHYRELNNYLPKGFEMLLIASATKLEECTDNNIVCLSMPIKMQDLLNTLQMMSYNYLKKKKKLKDKPKPRSEGDKAIIAKAKLVLMERNNMTEEEAHRYIQKNSMDTGTNMVEMAEMILSLM